MSDIKNIKAPQAIDDPIKSNLPLTATPVVADGKNKHALDVFSRGGTVTGEVVFRGLSIAQRNSVFIVGDTPIKLPTNPLEKRNTMSIHNKHETETLYIGASGVGVNDWEVPPNGFYGVDIAPDIDIYGTYAPGVSGTVKVRELA